MGVANLIETVAATRRRLASRIRESSACFPRVRRKRRVMTIWVLTAHKAQIAFLASLLFLQFGFPRLLDAGLERVFPEDVSGKLVGLFGGESRADKHRNATGRTVTAFAWVGCGSLAMLLFWIHIPAAVSRSTTVARRREAEADALLEAEPSKSVVLYRSALALACDPEYEAALEDKLHSIDARLSAATLPAGGQIPRQRQDLVAGRYAVTEELGRGANGVVYRAEDAVLGRQVALKELPVQLLDDESLARRFRQEARVLAQLNHPNIVQVYDFIEHDRRMWIAIELVEGGDLDSFLKRRGSLAAGETARLGSLIADAVAFAHDRGIVHRDLKPLNVLLADENTPKVTDFGLAKLTEGSVHTVEGTVMGSPHYMSPEQAEGKPIDHRADIYALGIILYRMLTGKVPFEGDIASVLAQHVRKPPPRPRKVAPGNGITPKLEKLVLAMLAKRTADRPGNMTEVVEELRHFSFKLTASS